MSCVLICRGMVCRCVLLFGEKDKFQGNAEMQKMKCKGIHAAVGRQLLPD